MLGASVNVHTVTTCWVFLVQIWPFSNLTSMSQQSGQTRCDAICCIDMLRSFGRDLITLTFMTKFMINNRTDAWKTDVNLLSPDQTIVTCQRNISQQCWVQHVVHVWPPCCKVLRHVGCCWLKFKNGQIRANNTQHTSEYMKVHIFEFVQRMI